MTASPVPPAPLAAGLGFGAPYCVLMQAFCCAGVAAFQAACSDDWMLETSAGQEKAAADEVQPSMTAPRAAASDRVRPPRSHVDCETLILWMDKALRAPIARHALGARPRNRRPLGRRDRLIDLA